MKIDYDPSDSDESTGLGRRAACCISIDFDVTIPSRFDANQRGTVELIRLAEAHGIPLTWAVCGQTAERDMRSYSAVINSSVTREIGIHTYSHMDAQANPASVFKSDIQRCIQTLNLETQPKTFVFPWNREAHFDVLNDLGFEVFRGSRRAIGAPVRAEGMWNIRPVYYIDQKSAGSGPLMKEFVDFCISRSATCHFWSHPWSIMDGGRSNEMLATLDDLFAYLAEKKHQEELTLDTMGGLGGAMDASIKHLPDLSSTTTAQVGIR